MTFTTFYYFLLAVIWLNLIYYLLQPHGYPAIIDFIYYLEKTTFLVLIVYSNAHFNIKKSKDDCISME